MRINISLTLALLLSTFAVHIPGRAQQIDVLSSNVSEYWVNETQQRSMYDGVYRSYVELDDDRHSLQFGTAYPGLTLILITDMFGVIDTDYNSNESNFSEILDSRRHYWSGERVWPCISVEYQCKTNSWFSLGMKGAVGWKTRARRDIFTDKVHHRENQIFTSLLFDMRFSYLRREWVTMYSSIGFGAMYYHSFKNRWMVPMLDITWVGLTVGRGFYGFAEFGGGACGFLRAGLGFRF